MGNVSDSLAQVSRLRSPLRYVIAIKGASLRAACVTAKDPRKNCCATLQSKVWQVGTTFTIIIEHLELV